MWGDLCAFNFVFSNTHGEYSRFFEKYSCMSAHRRYINYQNTQNVPCSGCCEPYPNIEYCTAAVIVQMEKRGFLKRRNRKIHRHYRFYSEIRWRGELYLRFNWEWGPPIFTFISLWWLTSFLLSIYFSLSLSHLLYEHKRRNAKITTHNWNKIVCFHFELSEKVVGHTQTKRNRRRKKSEKQLH